MVDMEDSERVLKRNWCAVKVGTESHPIYYAKDSKTMQYMHAFILGSEKGSLIECLHGPGGTLDNRRSNLRLGDKRKNQRDRSATGTTSKYKGVSWNGRAAKWVSHIMAGDEYYFLGYFTNEIDAAFIYDVKARELHGQYARLNFPESGETSAINPDLELVCNTCKQQFVGPSNLAYCGIQCVMDAFLPTRQCMKCSGQIKGYSKFCSSECRAEFLRDCNSVEPPGPVQGAEWVKLTLGKYCLIDSSDVAIVSPHKWYAKEVNGVWYACRSSTREEIGLYGNVVRMHRMLMNLIKSDLRDVGHADGDGLNNRRGNLYLTDNTANHMNVSARGASGYKGVSCLSDGMFFAKIYAAGKYEYIGRFRSDVEAAKAYDDHARLLHGEDGRYNFPRPGERSAKR